MIGWLVYKAVKPAVKRAIKSKARVPVRAKGTRVPKGRVFGVAGAAGLLGAFMFWRSRRSDGGEPPSS